MKKVWKEMGCFDEINCCIECDWFQSRSFLARPRQVCPDCGGELRRLAGQYKIRKTKGLFSTETECVGFVRSHRLRVSGLKITAKR